MIKSKKGVTLVELLAVVVILGIIAAIAVPTIGGLIERQRENAAQATYDTIIDAAQLYAEDDTPFTLQDMEDDDFIDLKDNTFSFTETGADVLPSAIYIVVDGTTVTFYDADPDGTGEVTAIFVNGYTVE